MPETGALEGAPERVDEVRIGLDDQEYAPVAGIPELRQAVASMYKRPVSEGQILPVHRAHRLHLRWYEELLDVFKPFTAIPILLEGARGYRFSPEDVRHEITGRGLLALLVSNPNNPTGRVFQGAELESWVDSRVVPVKAAARAGNRIGMRGLSAG